MARKEGKIIDTIRHLSNGIWFDIPLRMTKSSGSLRETVHYFYTVNMDTPYVHIDPHKDATEVIKKAKEAIDKHTTIKWEKFLHVNTKSIIGAGRGFHRDLDGGKSAELSIHFRAVMIGTNCAGEKVHVVLESIDAEFDPSRHIHIQRSGISTEIGKPTFENGIEASSLLPYTEDNVARLHTIVDGLAKLGTMVTDLMRNDKIQASLINVSKTLNIGHKKG